MATAPLKRLNDFNERSIGNVDLIRLVPTESLVENEPDVLVSKIEIEAALRSVSETYEYFKTLKSRTPRREQENEKYYSAKNNGLTAKADNLRPIAPLVFSSENGFRSPDRPLFEQYMTEVAQQVFRANVPVVHNYETPESKNVIKRYNFDQAVISAASVIGELFTETSDGNLIPWRAGVPTTSIVQIITADNRNGVPSTLTFRCVFRDGVAIWSNHDYHIPRPTEYASL